MPFGLAGGWCCSDREKPTKCNDIMVCDCSVQCAKHGAEHVSGC